MVVGLVQPYQNKADLIVHQNYRQRSDLILEAPKKATKLLQRLIAGPGA